MRFIPDKELIKIKARKSSERLISIKDTCPEIIINIDPESRALQHLKKGECYARESVAKKLCSVNKNLPSGIRLMIWDAYRSIEAQEKMHMRYVNKLKKAHPSWNNSRIMNFADKFIANPQKICLHATGGAVDVTLCNDSGKELNMGSSIDSFIKKSETNSKSISNDAKKNRAVLKRCMEKQGFINYPLEWWHWSYGDSYWAAEKKKKFAIYGHIEKK